MEKIILDVRLPPVEKRKPCGTMYSGLPTEGEILVIQNGKVLKTIKWGGIGVFFNKGDEVIRKLEKRGLIVERSKDFKAYGNIIAKENLRWVKSSYSGAVTPPGGDSFYGGKVVKASDVLAQQLAFLSLVKDFCQKENIPPEKVMYGFGEEKESLLRLEEKMINTGTTVSINYLFFRGDEFKKIKIKIKTNSEGTLEVEIPVSYSFLFQSSKMLLGRIRVYVFISRLYCYGYGAVTGKLILPEIEKCARVLGLNIDEAKNLLD